jgi:hypothetical protein
MAALENGFRAEAPVSADEMAELTKEIAELKARGADRVELSRQAANALFFKLGRRPSVVLVRQVTGTGSNSDISNDLAAWWTQLREQTSLNLHADLQGLADTVTPLLRALLTEAGKVAQVKLDEERARLEAQDRERAGYAEAEVRHAKTMEEAAELQAQEALAALALERAALVTEKRERDDQVAALRHEIALAAERAGAAQQAAAEREHALRQAVQVGKEQLQEARAELETQRQLAERDKGFLEDRRRMLEQLLQESKTEHSQSQKALKAATSQIERLERQAAGAAAEHAKQATELTLALGEANGQLRAIHGERDRLAEQLAAARQQNQILIGQAAEGQAARQVLADRIHQLLPRLAEVHEVLVASFEVDPAVLEELAFQALANGGKLPASVRKHRRHGGHALPLDLFDAVDAAAAAQ